jgi:hypothetical protein
MPSGAKISVFLSFASEDRPAAALVDALLTANGHAVFFDRNTLPPGESYHAAIRNAVNACDCFVFFVSASSVLPGKFCLTELGYAAKRWPNPHGKVLPVALESTLPALPPYLSTVTALALGGNVAAAVLDQLQSSIATPESSEPPSSQGKSRRHRLLALVVRSAGVIVAVAAALSLLLAALAPRPLFWTEKIGILVTTALVTLAVTVYRRRATQTP